MTPNAFALEKLFGVPLYRLANARGRDRLGLLLRLAFSVFGKRFTPPPSCDGVLFFNTTPRLDYRRLFEGAFNAFGGRKSLWQPKNVPAVNLGALALFLTRLRDLRHLATLAAGPLARWYLYLCWIRCLQVLRMAEQCSPTGVVVMGDMQLTESALVQWANQRGLPTVTCQHGLYMDDGPTVLPDNVNTINYLNVTSRHFLAWGARTCALVMARVTTRCHVVGNPGLGPGNRQGARSYFYVLTDSSLRFHAYNQALLGIARQVSAATGMRYFVRYHPDNDPAAYGMHPVGSAGFPLDDACFAIGHMTSQIYVSMRQGVPVYRLASAIPNHPIPPELIFQDAEELMGKAVPHTVFDHVARDFIAHVGEEAAARYEAVLEEIMT